MPSSTCFSELCLAFSLKESSCWKVILYLQVLPSLSFQRMSHWFHFTICLSLVRPDCCISVLSWRLHDLIWSLLGAHDQGPAKRTIWHLLQASHYFAYWYLTTPVWALSIINHRSRDHHQSRRGTHTSSFFREACFSHFLSSLPLLAIFVPRQGILW